MKANTDTLTNAVALLRQFNAWRRDGEGVLTMPKPTEIGIALDTVLDAVGELATVTAERDELREALQSARVWGIAHVGYDGSYARRLGEWVDGGFHGAAPDVEVQP